MKNLFLSIVAIMFVMTTYAQISKSYIEVTGIAQFEKPVQKYVAKLAVSEDIIYDRHNESAGDSLALTVDVLIDTYFKKLAAANFDPKKLVEDPFGYLTIGFRKEGKLFTFETTSKEEYKKVLSVSLDGTQIYSKYLVYKLSTNTEIELSKRAIENAKQKAEIITKSTNKKIGDIITISDNNNRNEIKEVLYFDNLDEKGLYDVTVRFELL